MLRPLIRSSLVALAASCATPQLEAPSNAPTQALTVERILASPGLAGTAPVSPSWSPDSAGLAFLWNDAAGPRREIWWVAADGEGLRHLTAGAPDQPGVRELVWLPDSRSLAFLRGRDLWLGGLDGDAELLSAGVAARSDLGISPDGQFLTYLESGDLWWFDLAAGAPRQLTFEGQPSISRVPLGRYRRPDVEIGPPVWGGPTYAWSPDGRTIAVHHVDRSRMRSVPFPHYLGAETDPNLVRRSYPGDANASRRIGLFSTESGELEMLDLPDPTQVRVVGFHWSPNGQLLIDREADTAEDRWLHVLDPESRALTELWHDRRESRVYTSVDSGWHPDGEHVVFLSDLNDRYGLYLVGPGAPWPRPLTPPEYDVTAGPLFGATGDTLIYQANQPNPYERHVFRIAGSDAPVRLTRLPGQHRPYPAPNGRWIALLHSSDTSPTELFLVDAEGRAPELRVTHSPPPEFAERPWARARYLTFPSRIDGHTLHARLLEPQQLDLGKRYPVIFGPVYSNTVRNRWAGRWALIQQLLVERGFLVVQVDVRGSTGYGRAFREDFLVDFAGKDLEDLHSAVEHLRTLPHVDPDRLGLWGSSYGGTLTVYALLKKPGLFQAGVAGAAAVDPHFFGSDDVAIVRRPESHPEAFARGAAQFAANLQDPLLLIHGMQDQVVPFKTVADLSDALIRAGKDFDFAIAPSATHSWTSDPANARYLLSKLLTHFERHLGPD
ncbi:MAG: prolyl oligopeptidase family serine peptidase [Planctomycetota bacterium]|jgi:dipeptidyl-peptidase-4